MRPKLASGGGAGERARVRPGRESATCERTRCKGAGFILR